MQKKKKKKQDVQIMKKGLRPVAFIVAIYRSKYGPDRVGLQIT